MQPGKAELWGRGSTMSYSAIEAGDQLSLKEISKSLLEVGHPRRLVVALPLEAAKWQP